MANPTTKTLTGLSGSERHFLIVDAKKLNIKQTQHSKADIKFTNIMWHFFLCFSRQGKNKNHGHNYLRLINEQSTGHTEFLLDWKRFQPIMLLIFCKWQHENVRGIVANIWISTLHIPSSIAPRQCCSRWVGPWFPPCCNISPGETCKVVLSERLLTHKSLVVPLQVASLSNEYYKWS